MFPKKNFAADAANRCSARLLRRASSSVSEPNIRLPLKPNRRQKPASVCPNRGPSLRQTAIDVYITVCFQVNVTKISCSSIAPLKFSIKTEKISTVSSLRSMLTSYFFHVPEKAEKQKNSNPLPFKHFLNAKVSLRFEKENGGKVQLY